MNILVATLGGSWQVIPEIVGFTNPATVPLYSAASCAAALADERENHSIGPVDEVRLVATAGTRDQADQVERWRQLLPRPLRLRVWYPEGVDELFSVYENRAMAEVIYRVVLHARHDAEQTGGCLYLSLAGGRKTMSAELQQAGYLFGCHAILHVVDRLQTPEERKAFSAQGPECFTRALAPEFADQVRPLVTSARMPGSEALQTPDHVSDVRTSDSTRFPLPEEGEVPAASDLYDEAAGRLQQADALLVNHRLQISQEEPLSNFRALYGLAPHMIRELREHRVGLDPKLRDRDREWLRRLPKGELHCHLGGILSPAAMIEVATAVATEVEEWARRVPDFARWRERLAAAVAAGDWPRLHAVLPGDDLKTHLRTHLGIPEPYPVAALLLAFRERSDALDAFLYGDLADPERFVGVRFELYEALGDLQGSGLLQAEQTLRATLHQLVYQCERDHVYYLELRCSPLNYTRGGLTSQQVVGILLDVLDELYAITATDGRLIFIASRHRDIAAVREHIRLALELRQTDERFAKRFVGFDLAGAEHACPPAQLREEFRPLHHASLPITIHAGEDQPADNIWEAVYELSADRIGHGLTLAERPDMIQRFADRRIALEMCPSSNRQICGYRHRRHAPDHSRVYPLSQYLNEGLRVTVNTDDPGISRTTLTDEYLHAAEMTPQGLSRWALLQLVRNSFQAAFCSRSDRRRHLLAAERKVMEQLQEQGPG